MDEASDAEDQLIEALPGIELAITQMGPFTERVLDAAPDLRFLVVCRGGPVNVNVPAATKRGVMVASTPGRNAVAAAEHAVALMMGALRNLPATATHAGAGRVAQRPLRVRRMRRGAGRRRRSAWSGTARSGNESPG